MLHGELHGLSMDLSWNVSTCCFAGREGERVGKREGEGGREGGSSMCGQFVDS